MVADVSSPLSEQQKESATYECIECPLVKACESVTGLNVINQTQSLMALYGTQGKTYERVEGSLIEASEPMSALKLH